MKNNEKYRNEIKSCIVWAGMTMSEVVDILADEYGWGGGIVFQQAETQWPAIRRSRGARRRAGL